MARPFKRKIVGKEPRADEFKPRGIPSSKLEKNS